MYDLIFRGALSRLDAETAHSQTIAALRLLQRTPGALPAIRRVLARPDPALQVTAMGLQFPGPLGLAAGFDKDAEVFSALAAFGFDFVEIGTVTAQAQPGNPRPRMVRLPADRALVNRMGFNNHGAGAAARRLSSRRSGQGIVGANIGKTKVVAPQQAIADYAASAELLAPHCDYLVVNVSSPNTPGLRDLQAVHTLKPLLREVLDICRDQVQPPPVLVKLGPDLADADVDAIADLVVETGLDGIVATNTTIDRSGLASATKEVSAAGSGGLSGAPLKTRSLDLLRRLHRRVGQEVTLVSVGGIETPTDVWLRVMAGASLVQAYTGLVYSGPAFARRIHLGLPPLLRSGGFTRLQDAIGTGPT
ncbi:MAG: quinone-dependent dihydroorotate dehydrogenase [Euzebya sp.]